MITESMSDLKFVLNEISDGKVPGLDRSQIIFFLNSWKLLRSRIEAFYSIYDSGEVPTSLTESIISPLLEKGDINEVVYYRAMDGIY